jgi:hypothetical protein
MAGSETHRLARMARIRRCFFNGVVLDTTGVNIDFLLINFRPGRTETNVVHGCATIFNGSKPLEMKESGSRIF